jgi:hypothetical protein
MQIIDLENQSLVGTVIVLEAIASEMLISYLKGLKADQRQAACTRISDQVAANGKAIVELAPKAQISNAQKIQAAAARMVKSAMADALAELAKT